MRSSSEISEGGRLRRHQRLEGELSEAEIALLQPPPLRVSVFEVA